VIDKLLAIVTKAYRKVTVFQISVGAKLNAEESLRARYPTSYWLLDGMQVRTSYWGAMRSFRLRLNALKSRPLRRSADMMDIANNYVNQFADTVKTLCHTIRQLRAFEAASGKFALE
jgi:hypothetical protein